ncbi:MAG: insulinase family protein [Bacteroidaceae bacterium]|nr:insulinase family protein [Bacteroidaceae bacterium]
MPTLPAPIHLDNGVEVHVIPMPSTELVTISIMFFGGQWVQEKKLQSNLALQQIKSGTESFTAEFLSDKLDYYGATITADATINYGFLRLNCLRRTLPDVLPLFREIITSPTYEQPLFDNAIEESYLSYQVSEQKVAYVSKRVFYQQLLGFHHPAAQYVDEQAYQNIRREDLLAYHQQFITLSNAVIYVTGNVDDALLALVNSQLGSTPCGEPHPHAYQRADIISPSRMMHETTLNVPSVQSGLRLGKVLPDASSADFPAIHLSSVILGGYFGSRLMKNIRERLGFTYGIGSTFYPIPHNNIFIIATETPREHVARCIEEIKKDIADMQQHPASNEELDNARNFMLGQFCRTTEVSLSLSTLLMHQRAQGRTLNDLLQEQQQIQSITPEDIMQSAQKYFSPDELLIAVAHGK